MFMRKDRGEGGMAFGGENWVPIPDGVRQRQSLSFCSEAAFWSAVGDYLSFRNIPLLRRFTSFLYVVQSSKVLPYLSFVLFTSR